MSEVEYYKKCDEELTKLKGKKRWKKDVCYIDDSGNRRSMYSRQSDSAIIAVYFLVLNFWEVSLYVHQYYRIKFEFF